MIFTDSPLADMFLLATLALVGLHTFHQIRRGSWILFDPLNLFWAAVLFFYVYQPVMHYRVYCAWRGQSVLELTCGYILAGSVLVLIGYEAKLGAWLARQLPVLPHCLNPARLQAVAFALVVLGLVSYYFQFQSAGGVDEWLAVPRGGTDKDKLANYVSMLAHFLPFGVLLLVLHVNLHPVSVVKSGLAWGAGGLLWLWYVYLGSRTYTVSIACLLLAAFYLPRRRNPPFVMLGALGLTLFVLTNFQRSYRDHFTDLSFHLDEIDLEEAYQRSVPTWLGGSPDLQRQDATRGDEYHCVMAVVDLVPGQVPFNFGYGFLHVFTLPIPRELWPEKVYPLYDAYREIYIRGELDASDTGVNGVLAGPSFTFAGFWLSVGGPLALAAGGLLTGAFLRLLRAVYDRAPRAEGAVLWLALMFPTGLALLSSEIVITAFHFIPLQLLPCLTVLRVTRGT